MASILVVDDERSMREMLDVYLRRQGHEVVFAGSLAEGLSGLRGRSFDLVLTDLRLGRDSGLSVLADARARTPAPEVIMMTAFSTIETAVQAMKAGAYDYVQKPFNLDELKLIIDRALERRRLVVENGRLRAELGRPSSLVGKSPAMAQLVRTIDKVASVRANVLITGESGVGKEVVAREVHARGPRDEAPFLAVNCAAIPEGLIESELFGHVRGAFTGASASREGLLATAGEGTLFLDEIAELPKDIQVKLLRVIEERKARPVGSSQSFDVGARLIAATNRDLTVEVAAGRFREDLYYRLDVIHLHIPPLRERREDVLPLAEHFLAALAAIEGGRPHSLSRAAAERLFAYDFPGNVRELRNVIERAAALAEGEALGPDILPPVAARPGARSSSLPEAGIDLDAELQRIERVFLQQALERSAGSRTAAAKLLGMSFRSFRYRLAKLGLPEGKVENGEPPEE